VVRAPRLCTALHGQPSAVGAAAVGQPADPGLTRAPALPEAGPADFTEEWRITLLP
jgi:hypothetical protein